MAVAVDYFQDLPSAIYHLEQAFSIRDVKTGLHALALILQEKGGIESTASTAKELARLAMGALRKFDRHFRSRTPNSCGCVIGGKELRVDFNHLFEDLQSFIESIQVVDDCPINGFLDFGAYGKAGRLLGSDDVVKETKAGKNLQKLCAAKKSITCTQCKRIGDAVIALDQPKSWCLVHIDKDFPILCAATHRNHKQIQSERAIDNDVPKVN